ncbi:DUF6916 family protein [Nocardioides bizhenqiangii]|uniref:DUF6916 domain-containing protein n=1 Tax=Nocardioides bizhenqiangii TaxID=3095076 RepID=A0ABZ0ZWV1_9ACTN|nr:hypothetical protein [Nocardioides sp. HM61]WQQ28221.1 hypothetical protein SHK19_08295 [Nocardioides sp. HM61]
MTDVSRRSLIGAGAAALAAGALGVGPPTVAHAADPSYTSAASLYRRSRFAVLRGRGFAISAGGARFRVRLTGVADLPEEAAGSETSFRLTFTSRSPGPEQGTYALRRDGFAKTSVFLVPDAGRRTYTAVVHSA